MTNNRDDDDRKDLTQIGELPEFQHEEDESLNLKFNELNPATPPDSSTVIDLDSLDEDKEPYLPDLPTEENESSLNLDSQLPEVPEIQNESTNEFSSESIFESEIESESESEFESESPAIDEGDIFSPVETDFSDISIDSNEDFATESNTEDHSEENGETSSEFEETENEYTISEIETPQQEKFDDVKAFAQNFSYGTIEGAGNPPYSIIVRNIRFEDDAEDILTLLKEFGIVNDSNLKENENALKMGSILISQISEFTAIVLAHKLRRYDLDIEVGLADAIHPSKSGEYNPRGLTKKDALLQNKSEELKLFKLPHSVNEIIISNSIHLDGYKTLTIVGVETAHTFISEEELHRLNFVEEGLRNKNVTKEDEKIYLKYKDSFKLLHDELVNEIKIKALKEGVNALLNVQFTLSSFADHKNQTYQITCTCTKAQITKG